MVRPALLCALLLLLGACETTPGVDADDRPLARAPLRVTLLDSFFVVVDGQRLARDEFVYRSRLQCRDWTDRGVAPPACHISWAEGAVPPRFVSELIAQLRLAGIQKVQLGD